MPVQDVLLWDSKLISEWIAYHEIDPFGNERSDLSAAIISQTIARSMGNDKSKLANYLPDFESKEMTQELMKFKLGVK